MRVLIVEPDSRAGSWHYATALAGALGRIGLTVAVATLFPVEPMAILSDLRIIQIGRHAPPGSRRVTWLPVRAAFHLSKIAGLRRAIRQFRPDIVHVHTTLGKLDGTYFRYLRARGIRVCYTTHWLESLDGRPGRAELFRHKQVDALFVHSTDGASRLRREGIDGTKIWTLTHPNLQHVAGPPISSSAARQKLGLPSGSRVLLFFGVIEARKGLDILIDAFALLARAHPELWLAVAGAAPGGFEPYAAQIDARSVRERVVSDIRYLPFEEISTYFSAAEIVVLPYRRIVQSGILQLAYGFERPVVVSNVGGISETVQEDGTGVVAASLKAEDLAAAIDQLLRSPDLAAAMAARGRRLSDTKYSWQTVATQIADAYQAVLGRTSRPAP